MRLPAHCGIAPREDVARFTYAVISRTRTSSSARPPKVKTSPGLRREMNDSSIAPIRPPVMYATLMVAFATIVPTLLRCRRTRSSRGTR